MKYNLLFPNIFRQRLLAGVLTVWLCGAIFLAAKLDEPVGFGLLIAFPVSAFVWSFFPKLADSVFWCPFWAVVAEDGVAWQKSADEQLNRYEFVDVSSYRFVPNKGSVLVRLRLRSGADIKLVCRLNNEFAAFQTTFEKAISAHNQANPEAKLAEESNALEQFFTRRASTYVLGCILAVDTLSVAWGIHVGATGIQYAPLVLSFPYFLVWLTYVGRRT